MPLLFEDVTWLLFRAFSQSLAYYSLPFQSLFRILEYYKRFLLHSPFLPAVPSWLTDCISLLYSYIIRKSLTFALSSLRVHHLLTISWMFGLSLPSDEQLFSWDTKDIDSLYLYKTQASSWLLFLREMFHGRFSYSKVFLTCWRTVSEVRVSYPVPEKYRKLELYMVSSGQNQHRRFI